MEGAQVRSGTPAPLDEAAERTLLNQRMAAI